LFFDFVESQKQSASFLLEIFKQEWGVFISKA